MAKKKSLLTNLRAGDKKSKLIHRILDQQTYNRNSLTYTGAEQGLRRMTIAQLAALCEIIERKGQP